MRRDDEESIVRWLSMSAKQAENQMTAMPKPVRSSEPLRLSRFRQAGSAPASTVADLAVLQQATMRISLLIAVAFSSLLSACKTIPASNSRTVAATYSDPFDPWRACNKELPEAIKGNPMAIHTCFLAAYVRKSNPYLGGEDLESVWHCIETILEELGDDRFSHALAYERPEVRAAVGDFLDKKHTEGTPKTRRLIDKAPKIEFPLDLSYRDESKSVLLQEFMRYEREHFGQ